MVQISKIAKAWLNVLKKRTTSEHMRRAKICTECPKSKYVKYIDFIDDELTEVKGFICSVCSCPLIAKIRSEENCPENLW